MVVYRLIIFIFVVVIWAGCHDSSKKPGEEIGQEEKIITEENNQEGQLIPPSDGPISVSPLLPAPPITPDFWERDKAERRGNHDDNICDDCIFATSTFSSGPDGWYDIITSPYPQTVPLSLNGNFQFREGNILTTDTGITINEGGSYWVSVNVILLNENQEYTPLIPIFLVPNDVFDPLAQSTFIGTTVSVMPDVVTSVNVDGIVPNLSRGTTLSLVATNGGSPQPEIVTVVSWSISLFRICD